jgi:signal transduction histidine kinase
VDLSPQALGCLGYSPEEAKDLMSALEQGQVPITPKTTFKISDAKPERILERSALPVWGYSGRAIGWMIVLRDVSEENQIAQARELITETLVHDLRSPLSAVMGALDVMEEIIQQGDQMTDLTAQAMLVAKRSSQRILGMIESLLDISRMQSGKLDLMLAPVNLQAVVANAMANYVQQANEFGIIIRNEIPFDLPMFCADQSKLTRVLVNLLDNSLKFTPSGGQVIFSAEPLPDEIIAVKVIDSGPGVPEEYRDKIFERFTQIPGQHGRRRGSGLGLTFCRLAVEAHGGRIWVEEREGGGSVFTFTLPLNPDTTCN